MNGDRCRLYVKNAKEKLFRFSTSLLCKHTIRESVTANLDHVCLDNQSRYSLDVIEFLANTVDMNEKCPNYDREFSHRTAFFFFGVNSIQIQIFTGKHVKD